MKAYPILDVNGQVIGRAAFENDDIPNLIMNGLEFKLDGAYFPNSKQFQNFILVPKGDVEK